MRQTLKHSDSGLSFRDAPKLFKINNDCVFYISGVPGWSWGEGKITKGSYDFALDTKRWIRAHGCANIAGDGKRLKEYYKSQFTRFLSSAPKASRPGIILDASGQPVFAIIGIVFRVRQQLIAKEFEMFYRSGDPIDVDVVVVDHSTEVRILGESNVVAELLSGHRPEFEGFRRESVMREVLPVIAAGKYESLPADIVWTFAKRAIVLTSEHSLPGMTPNSISSNSQCLAMSPVSGITRSEL